MALTPEPSSPEDLALVKDVLKNRRTSLEQLIKRMRCVPRILAAHNRRLGRPLDEHELADIGQDSLVVIWKKLPEYRGLSPIEGWVYRICVLELMNTLKKKRRRLRLKDEVISGANEETVSYEEGFPWRFEDLHAGLAKIPADEALVLQRKHFDNQTLDLIAKQLGVPLSTIKSRYYRGLGRLEEYLAEQGEELAHEHT